MQERLQASRQADRYLTIEDLSARWQIPVKTLRDWGYRGYGPQPVKLGRGRAGAVRYKLADVERFEREQEQAQPAGGAA
jgi:hypothetical protein